MREREERKNVKKTEPPADTIRRIINIIFTLAGIVLLFRLIFKLLGANPENAFVENLYKITDFVVGIFEGIFAEIQWQNGVFEPATVIALVVLFIISWLIKSLFAKRTVRQEDYRATTEAPKETRGELHTQKQETVEEQRTTDRGQNTDKQEPVENEETRNQ